MIINYLSEYYLFNLFYLFYLFKLFKLIKLIKNTQGYYHGTSKKIQIRRYRK